MSHSICLIASIPLANPNRQPPIRKTPSEIKLIHMLRQNPSLNSSTNNTTKTASATNLFSSISPIPSISLLHQHLPSPELGLASVYFSLFTVFAAFVSLGLISIPAMMAFRRLGISASRLEKVVAREVPGALLSLRLSSMEIGRLAKILSSMRHVLTGVGNGNIDNNQKLAV